MMIASRVKINQWERSRPSGVSEKSDWKGVSKSRSIVIGQGLLRFIISELIGLIISQKAVLFTSTRLFVIE